MNAVSLTTRSWARHAMIAAVLAAAAITFHSAKAADLKTIAVVCHCRADFPVYKAFEARLSELGWRDGETIRIVRRFSDGDPARLARNAEEATASKPDIVFAGFTPAVVAVHRRATTVPVVFAGVSDASEIGAASQINRPDHNFTGTITINRELMPKRLQLLKEALPALSTIGYLANPRYALHKPQLEEITGMARRLGVSLVVAEAASAAELEGAFARLATGGAQALLVQQDPLFTGQAAKVVALAEANRLPAVYALRGFYDAGGFMWYGADIAATFSRAADYVDKVLKGATPADLPIERPNHINLAIDLKHAQRLGIAISPAFLARADEVIE
jgi:putative tryptophan/tyrosine transport system substrate-binding protein